MNSRQRLLNFVKCGDDHPYISLQLGAGAGFDCMLAGKEWLSEGTVDDTITAYKIVGCDPLLMVGLPDPGLVVPELRTNCQTNFKDNMRYKTVSIDTPFGIAKWEFREQIKHGITPISYPIGPDTPNLFDIIKWYVEQHYKFVDFFGDIITPTIHKLQQHGATVFQWYTQPLGLLGLTSTESLAMLATLEPQACRNICDLICSLIIRVTEIAVQCGIDFVWLGGEGSEMQSPNLYKQYIVPDSRKITDAIHKKGGLVYCHICSPVNQFISEGLIDDMGIDLFETISAPPVGNVKDLSLARSNLNSNICTRGNLSLDILQNGSSDEIQAATINIINSTKGYKHIVAASDYLFYSIPLKNVQTMIKTVENY